MSNDEGKRAHKDEEVERIYCLYSTIEFAKREIGEQDLQSAKRSLVIDKCHAM
jgi:hypothetical protein